MLSINNSSNQLPSYVQDTTDFVNKIRKLKIPGNVLIASMDVSSLYPNIDHHEGADACAHYLDERKRKSLETSTLRKLILMVLGKNALRFGDRFFQQIKGTAMGTPMAVNYANLFMGRFEERLLAEYEKETGNRPAVWLRFIDDVFIVWKGEEKDFKHFISFCDSFASKHNLKSNIRFTSSPPSAKADFLDVSVSVNTDGTLSTNLFVKPTASFQYLHKNSYHVGHVTNSLPKSQFMRIRRICSNLRDYDHHANRFVEHFVKRKYPRRQLERTKKEVASMNRDDLLQYKTKPTSTDRIPLVLTYHHKFEGISRALGKAYQQTLRRFPNLKALMPNPPMIAYRRAKNIKDKLIRSDHHGLTIQPPVPSQSASRSILKQVMSKSNTITNTLANRSCKIQGGDETTAGAIYSAECTRHKCHYVGQTGRQLSLRFNNHRSDAKNRPEACKLAHHFHNNNCSMEKDLSVAVLEQVTGTQALREYKEDKWITRLQTMSPTGMNTSFATDFGPIYSKLFS